MTPKPKTVNYRRVEFEPAPGEHLQALLKRRLSTPGVGFDYSLTNAADSPHHVLSRFQTRQGILCGELLRFERGRDIPLVDVDLKGAVWTGAAPPVDSSGTRRNFADSSLYFAVKENHLALLQSAGLGLNDLQTFFAWILGIHLTGGDGNGLKPRLFYLRNIPSQSARAAIKGNEIRAIKIGSKLFEASRIPVKLSGSDGSSKIVKRTEYHIDANTKGILKALMKKVGANDAILDELDRHSDPGSIRVNLEISYTSRSEKDGQELMHSIAGALDDGDYPKASIRLKGGKVLKGEELTIRDSILVQTVNGNLVVDDALRSVCEWLREAIKSGKIV
jgi:hypothetical protein